MAVEISPTPRLAWSVEIGAIPAELIAADGKLFVVGEDGSLHCFGAKAGQPIAYNLKDSAEPENADSPPPDVLTQTKIREGYALVLGIDDGGLTGDLLRHSELRIIAVDADRGKIDALRRKLALEGPFDARFQGIVADPKTVRLPPYLASLIVSELPGLLTTDDRIFEMLHPYGGAAYLASSETGKPSIRRREGGLPGAADWTQETGDAARSYFSRDTLVKAPLGVLWYGDGEDHGFYKHKDYGHGVKPQVAGGRLFALQVASNTLHAVDCYTGRLLWETPVGESARYASWPDAVYVAQGRELRVLDAATGKTRATFALKTGQPAETPVRATEVRINAETVLVGLRFSATDRIEEGRWDCHAIVALDRKTGEQRWARLAGERFGSATIAMSQGRVFCIDSRSPIEIAEMVRRGADITKLTSTILTLDEKTGAEHWRYVLTNPPNTWKSLNFLGLRTGDDWLACAEEKNLLLGGKNSRTVALNVATGEVVWERDSKGQQPLIIAGDTFLNQVGHTYETATGKVLNGSRLFTHSGCNYAVGNKNLVFLRDNCAAYIDVKTREQTNLRNLRSGCSASLVAAGGVLNSPCFSVGCICNYPIQTSFAMVHLPEVDAWKDVTK